MKINDQAFMDMLKNKELVLKSIFNDIEVSQKNAESFAKLESLYKEGKEVNVNKALTACATSIRHSNEANTRMLMILLVYASGGNYNSDTATMLNKMGRGQEALQEMFNQKLKGS